MRPARILSGLTVLLALGTSAGAQTFPYQAIVTAPEVDVRSGPSPKFYATSKLKQNDQVTVFKQENNGQFLAIVPPDGSFSWINNVYLQRKDAGQKTAVVNGDDAEVRAGSQISNDPPTARSIKAKRGTPVVILDTKGVMAPDGLLWLPIAPVPQEYRYIPAKAVKPTTAPVVTVASAPPGGPGAAPAASELWRQAQEAEQAGRTGDAIRLYDEVYRQACNHDHDLAISACNRSNWLRSGVHAAGSPLSPSNNQAGPYAGGSADGRLTPSPAYPNGPNNGSSYPAGQATSQYTYAKDTGTSGFRAPATTGQTEPAPQASGPGYLRRAGFNMGDKPAYALQKADGSILLYVTAQPGVNLDAYVYHQVDLYGSIVYNGQVNQWYMKALQVTQVR